MDQIYVVQSPPRYDDAPPDPMTFTQSVNSTGSAIASAPLMSLHMLINPTQYIYICHTLQMMGAWQWPHAVLSSVTPKMMHTGTN